MKIKKGDSVKILKGKDAGKIGKIIKSLPKENKVVVEGLNLVKKHIRPKKQGEKGQVVEVPRPINISNTMLICPLCGKPTRINIIRENDSRKRKCKKCQGIFN
jgi:large subunit ribosomal protein L24